MLPTAGLAGTPEDRRRWGPCRIGRPAPSPCGRRHTPPSLARGNAGRNAINRSRATMKAAFAMPAPLYAVWSSVAQPFEQAFAEPNNFRSAAFVAGPPLTSARHPVLEGRSLVEGQDERQNAAYHQHDRDKDHRCLLQYRIAVRWHCTSFTTACPDPTGASDRRRYRLFAGLSRRASRTA